MIKATIGIDQVKRAVASLKEKRVKVAVNLGRNKISRYSGVLTGVYPALFTVRPDDSEYLGKTSYGYAELLCGSVRIRPDFCEKKD